MTPMFVSITLAASGHEMIDIGIVDGRDGIVWLHLNKASLPAYCRSPNKIKFSMEEVHCEAHQGRTDIG